MANHDKLLKRYIESPDSPSGDWWLNVPVGFDSERRAEVIMGGTKEIDAVCLVSRSNSPPDEYPFQNSVVEIVNSDRIHKQSDYRPMWEDDDFEGEQAVIVEAKTSNELLKGVGQLIVYRELLEANWGVEVDTLQLVTNRTDSIIEKACERASIQMK